MRSEVPRPPPPFAVRSSSAVRSFVPNKVRSQFVRSFQSSFAVRSFAPKFVRSFVRTVTVTVIPIPLLPPSSLFRAFDRAALQCMDATLRAVNVRFQKLSHQLTRCSQVVSHSVTHSLSQSASELLTGWLTGWLADRLGDRLGGWVAGWLTRFLRPSVLAVVMWLPAHS